MSARSPRAADLLTGLALSLVVSVVLAASVEAVFPRLLTSVPLGLQPLLPEPVRRLCQPSKAKTLPRDYTAILGDSYAEGAGDWRLSADPRRNGPYQTADVLHARGLGDVFSLGSSGAGSLRSLTRQPLGTLAYLAALDRPGPVEPPKTALVYFYEGNDLSDNWTELGLTFFPAHSQKELYDESAFQAFIAASLDEGLLSQARRLTWKDRFLFWPFAAAVLRRGFGAAPAATAVSAAPGGPPDSLEGPPSDLTEKERRAGLWVFRQALVFARGRWPATKFIVVYVPSPLSCYAPSARVGAASDGLAGEVRRLAAALGLPFIDARPALRAASVDGFVHGPRDWNHFNRRGYEALAEAIGPALE